MLLMELIKLEALKIFNRVGYETVPMNQAPDETVV